MDTYTSEAQNKIDILNVEKEDMSRKIEDFEEVIEEKNKNSAFWKTDQLIGGKVLAKRRDKKLAKMKDTLEKIDIKIGITQYEGINEPELGSEDGSLNYFNNVKASYDNAINKQKLLLDNSGTSVSKLKNRSKKKIIKKFEKLNKINDKNIRNVTRTNETIEREKAIAERKKAEFDKLQENKEPAENTETPEQPKEQPKLKSSGLGIQTTAPTESETPVMATETDTPDEAQKVSDVNFNSLNTENLGDISTLIGINTKIFETLLRIEENSFDEQDTSIKTSEVAKNNDTVIQVSKSQEKPEEESFFKKLLKGLLSLLGPSVLKFWKALKGSKSIKLLWNILKGAKSFVAFLAKHIWTSLLNSADVLKTIGKKILGPLKKGLTALKTKIAGVISKVTEFGLKLKNIGSKLLQKVMDTPLMKFLVKAKSKLQTLLFGVADKVKAAKDTIVEKASAVKNKVKDGISKVGDWFKSKKDTVVKKVSSVKDNIIKKAKNGYKAVKGKVVKVSQKVMGAIKKGVGKAVKFGKSKVTKLKGKALSMAKGKILPMIGKVLGKNTLKGLTTLLKFVPGVSILTGLGFGIYEAMQGNYKKAALEVVSGLVGSIPVVGPALGIATSIIGGNMLDDAEIKAKMKDPKSASTKSVSTKSSTSYNTGTELFKKDKSTTKYKNGNKYDDDDYINAEIAEEEKSEKSYVTTNKKPKAVEKQNAIATISNNGIKRDQGVTSMVTPQSQTTSINNVNVVKPSEDVNISEAFPYSYK